MSNHSLATLDTIVRISTEHSRETALVQLDQLTQEDPAFDTPLLCAASILVGRANLARFTDQDKIRLEQYVTEGENRAQQLGDPESTEALFALGVSRLLRLLCDQVNGRTSTQSTERAIHEGRAFIERAYHLEPSNELYGLASAVALRFFPTRLKDRRKQEGIALFEALSRKPGSVGVVAKILLADSAMRRGQAKLLLELSHELEKDLPKAACPHILAATAHNELGDLEAAENSLESATRKNPGDEEVRHALGNIQTRLRGRSPRETAGRHL